ncbi:MAG TPA: hypothetical protein VNK43_10310 [Gemmatimonadales bacterium]|nr:hypothetical protein [Gemmatimonadales bacterium]
MTYRFKIARRLARARSRVWLAGLVVTAACSAGDGGTGPAADQPPADPGAEPALASATSCLSQTGPLVVLSGSQKTYDTRTTAKPSTRIDARAATWYGSTAFPVKVGSTSAPGACWSGGSITGTFSTSVSWRTTHSTAAMFMESPGFVIENVKINNYGDGVRILEYTDNWTIRGSRFTTLRDDCVENDRLYSGLIDDTFFEGCYVFLSERPGTGVDIPVDGRQETVTIQNSLVWLKPMPQVYRGTAPGTGPLFKWDNDRDRGTRLVINNTIFRIDQKPNHGDLKIPSSLVSCSNNTIVWLGSGPYPERVPSCFKVTTSRAVWDNAVAAWKAAHPGM